MPKTIKKIFTDEELKQIPEMYKSGQNINIIREKMHTSLKKIRIILLNNGIDIKNPDCKYLKHKPANYWTNKEHCEEAAKRCRNRSDFSDKYEAAYIQSVRNGWLSEFDQYFSNETLFYGFNDTIHTVYAYEITEQHAVYVGRTINLKQRHAAHKRGTFTTSHRVYSDGLFDFCNEHGCEIPEPLILEDKLNAKESQSAEGKWVEKYRADGWFIINRATTGDGSGSLGATTKKWTYETCEAAASKCNSKTDYRRKFPTASRVAIQNKWINDFFTTNLIKDKGCFDTLDACIIESKKFVSMSDMKRRYPFLYHKICKNKWNESIRVANGWDKYQRLV